MHTPSKQEKRRDTSNRGMFKVSHYKKNHDILVCVFLDIIKGLNLGYILNMGRETHITKFDIIYV